MTGNRGSCHLQSVGGPLHLTQHGGAARLGDLHRGHEGARGPDADNALRDGSAGQQVREPPRPTVPPTRGSGSVLPLPQVLDGDVAAPEPVNHDIHLSLKVFELGVEVDEVGGPGAPEEGKEAMEHM